jgi:hypothetical protein
MRVAGLSEVPISTVENFNVTNDVPGHMAYRAKMPILLRKVGWEVGLKDHGNEVGKNFKR